jgi:hypothetical protein
VALRSGQSGTGQVTLAQLAEKVHGELTKLLPKGLLVRSVTIPLIRFDPKVQEALDKYQQALAETQIAEQRKKTAEAQKAANDILAAANNSPGVLFQNCLDMTERMAQQGKPISTAWSCGSPLALTVPIKQQSWARLSAGPPNQLKEIKWEQGSSSSPPPPLACSSPGAAARAGRRTCRTRPRLRPRPPSKPV